MIPKTGQLKYFKHQVFHITQSINIVVGMPEDVD